MVDLEESCVFAASVRAEFEDHGFGRRLMEKAEDCLLPHHPTIWLETAEASRASGFIASSAGYQ